jgi:hypothetical protein
MTVTRSQAKAVFHHVLDNVLGKNDSSPLKQSLLARGMKDICDLCTIDYAFIGALVFDKSPTEIDVPVSMDDKEMVMAFLSYKRHVQRYGGLTDWNDWMTLTQEHFDNYRRSHLCPVFYLPNAVTITPNTSTTYTTEQHGSVTKATTVTTVNFNEASDDESTWPSMDSTCTYRPDEHGTFVRVSMSSFRHITEIVCEETTSLWGDTSESDDDVIDEAVEFMKDIKKDGSNMALKE